MNEITTKTKKTTELAVREFAALAPGGEMAELIAANYGGEVTLSEQDLVSVKMPSAGSTSWTFEDVEGERTEKELVGLWVFRGFGGVLWPTDSPGNSSPVLVTNDWRTARRVGDDLGEIDGKILERFKREDGFFDWQGLAGGRFPECPFGYGAGRNGGKRVSEFQTVALLRPDDLLPLLIRITPGSFKPLETFIRRLRVPYWRTVIGVSLEKMTNQSGQGFSRGGFRLVGTGEKDEGDRVKELYTDALSRSLGS